VFNCTNCTDTSGTEIFTPVTVISLALAGVTLLTAFAVVIYCYCRTPGPRSRRGSDASGISDTPYSALYEGRNDSSYCSCACTLFKRKSTTKSVLDSAQSLVGSEAEMSRASTR
jgi:hypothetical protein